MPASQHGSLDESQLREIESLGAAGFGPAGIIAELSLSPNFTDSEIQGLASNATQAADQYKPPSGPHGGMRSLAGGPTQAANEYEPPSGPHGGGMRSLAGGSTQAANQYRPPASQKLSHFFQSLAKTKGGSGGKGNGKNKGRGGGGGGEWGSIGKLLPIIGRGDPQTGSQTTGVPYAPGTLENPSIVGGTPAGSSSSSTILLLGGAVAIGAIAFLLLHHPKGETKK